MWGVLLWVFAGAASAAEPAVDLAVADPPAEPSPSGGVFGDKDPIEAVEEELAKEKTEEEKAREERLAQFNADNADKRSRVVVLQWEGTDTTYQNDALQRNIKNRIARTNASFFPDIDLYQHGRLEPDKSVRPSDQRAIVPDSVIPRVMSAVEDVAAIPYDAMSEQEWVLRAEELRKLVDEMWFIDRQELVDPLFMLYAQLGRAAENTNQNSPPYYANVDSKSVNYYFYLAGALAYANPALLSKLSDSEIYKSVSYYKDQIDAGAFSPMVLSFDDDGVFDPEQFIGDYQVFINGEERQINSRDGLLEVPIGVAYVHLKRADGFSLSEKIEHTTLPDRYDFVVQTAKKRMGKDFKDQLMEHPSDCMPQLAGDIVNYLSIYARLHPNEDIYIAVPFLGSTAPGRIYLWRWDRPLSALFLVEDNTGGFPVRFVAQIGAGMAFNGAELPPPDEEAVEQAVSEPPPPGEELDITGTLGKVAPIPELSAEGVPIYYQLRGHFNHLLAGVGIQYKIGLQPPADGGPQFRDFYQTDGNVVYSVSQCDPGTGTATTGATPAVCTDIAFRERKLQRLVYGLVGFTIGKDSAIGFGPRGFLRVGWYNAPHAADLTAHIGISSHPPGSKKDDQRVGRVRGLLDLDLFGGALLPYVDSFYIDKRRDFLTVGDPIPTFGFTAGAGLTF
ncbi:MAG: hypothetical protein ABMA64_39840 [Myxococcota bacterium]